MINESIFKTYDVRGIYPEEINSEAVEKIAAAQVQYLGAKKIVLGHDSRNSSPELYEAAKRVFLSLGVEVFDLDLVPIEVHYFACGNLKADGGFYVSASHNPREYNGIKLIREDAKPLTSGSGLEEVKEIALKMSKISPTGTSGSSTKVDAWPEYLEKVYTIIGGEKIKPIKIICDASSGVAGLALEKIAEKLPIEIVKLNFVPDGDFPNHLPNPLIANYRQQLVEECQKHNDISLAAIFDGDGDRVAFLDETGEFIDTDFSSALVTKILLDQNAGDPIVFDLRRGWAIKDQAEILGSKFYPAKSGYPFIKQKMREVGAVFGGEASAHYFYRDFFYSDSGIITLLLIVRFLSENNLKMSEATREYRAGYFMFEETNFKVKNSEKVVEKLKADFSDGKINLLDGLSIDYSDWHFNLRSSNTQPLIRLNVEGKNQEKIETMRDKIIKIIESFGGIEVEE
ncbi:MAG: phosphomannomutase/phosphoglucomutase [Candidatus Berkelbacteria bacterium]|nr:phosphomannomutase/phosphoglucomutase [Candidatus Berkelbacteria bacterium]